MAYRVLLTDALGPEGLARLREQPELEIEARPGLAPADLLQAVRGFHALIIRSGTRVTAEVLEHADALRVVGRAGIGVDNVDVAAATKKGVIVMNTPGGSNVTTAEHAITLMLALARNVPQAAAAVRAGRWERERWVGTEVCNKVLGIVGLGNIGTIVAERALGLRMKVIAYDPFVTPEVAARLRVELVSLDDLYARSDFITVHTPLTAETRGLIDEKTIARMKPGVRIINCARGGIVDERALADAIRDGKVAGAALDVLEKEPPPAGHPLLALDRAAARSVRAGDRRGGGTGDPVAHRRRPARSPRPSPRVGRQLRERARHRTRARDRRDRGAGRADGRLSQLAHRAAADGVADHLGAGCRVRRGHRAGGEDRRLPDGGGAGGAHPDAPQP
jgi:(S)-sulfolactate dehydrogenase